MRLKEDRMSWRSRGIVRRDFRHDPGLPESEIPRHKGTKRKKSKHKHSYKARELGWKIVRRSCYWGGEYHWYDDTVPIIQYYCECGHRRTSWGR